MKNIIAISILFAFTLINMIGCGPRTVPASATVQYRVFEVFEDDINKTVPVAKRTQTDSAGYALARVSSDDLKLLLSGIAAKPGLLTDSTRRVAGWPKVADTWTYTRADGTPPGSGGGAGFLGVGTKNGIHEVRIEYNVMHDMGATEPIRTKIAYEGATTDTDVLLFIKPFVRKDGTKLAHVIAFEVTDWR